MNKIVGFELAKMLKEKGFDEPCLFFYSAMEGQEGLLLPVADSLDSIVEFMKNKKTFFDKPSIDLRINKTLCNSYAEKTLTAPTIAEVVMWLYEKHNYWITVDVDAINNWIFEITNTAHMRNSYVPTPTLDSKTPDGAYVAAIYYCLTKLIKYEQTNI